MVGEAGDSGVGGATDSGSDAGAASETGASGGSEAAESFSSEIDSQRDQIGGNGNGSDNDNDRNDNNVSSDNGTDESNSDTDIADAAAGLATPGSANIDTDEPDPDPDTITATETAAEITASLSVSYAGLAIETPSTIDAAGLGEVLSSPDYATAFQDGVFGPQSYSVEQGLSLRAARTVSGGYADALTMHSLPDGGAVVEYAQTGNLAIGRGVETNITPMGSQLPGQIPGQLSSAQAEVIASYGPALDYAREVAFADVASAEAFAADVRARGFEAAFASYTAAQGLPGDELSGYSIGLGLGARAKAYGSATLQGAPGLERNWGAMVPGAYAHFTGDLTLGGRYTVDNPAGAVRMDKFDQYMDFGAPRAISVYAGGTAQAFGGISLGPFSDLEYVSENYAFSRSITTGTFWQSFRGCNGDFTYKRGSGTSRWAFRRCLPGCPPPLIGSSWTRSRCVRTSGC